MGPFATHQWPIRFPSIIRTRRRGMFHIRRRSGGTLIELLVVTAIIGIPLGLLLPASKLREKQRRKQCQHHLKQRSRSMHNIHSVTKKLPYPRWGPLNNLHAVGATSHSWDVVVLPYLEQSTLYNRMIVTNGQIMQ